MIRLERANHDRPVRWYSLLGLVLVPVLIAGGFLWATWDAQDRLGHGRAAVVNLDEPVTIDGQIVPLGRQLAGGLVTGPSGGSDPANLTWVLADAADARAGLREGRYVAVVTIPKDFSAAATSVGGDTAQVRQATIDVQTSQRSGITDPVIASAVATVATDTLNRTLTETYLDRVYVGINDVRTGLLEMADGTSQLADGADQLATGADRSAAGAAQLAGGMGQLSAGSAPLRNGASSAASGAAQLAAGLATMDSQLAGSSTFDTSQLPQLAAGSTRLRTGSGQLAGGITQLSTAATGVNAGLAQYQTGMTSVATLGLVDPATGTPICPAQIQAMGPQFCAVFTEGTKAGGQAAVAGLQTPDPASGYTLMQASDGLAAGMTALNSQAATFTAGATQLDSGIQQLVTRLAPLPAQMAALADGVHRLASGSSQLSSGLRQLSSGITRYTGGVDAAASGSRQLADGLAQLSDGARQLAEGTGTLAAGVREGADAAPSYDTAARDRLSTSMARPVTNPEVASAPVVSAPSVLMMLALWLGGLAAFTVLRAISARTLTSRRSSMHLVARSMLPAGLLALAQAAAITAICQSVLHLPGGTVARAFAIMVLAGLTFAAVNHALVAWLGGFGRVIAVAVAVLSTAGALTTATPRFFSAVRDYLPLTPGIDALREILLGGSAIAGAVALLCCWLAGAVLAGVLASARGRTVTAEAVVASLA